MEVYDSKRFFVVTGNRLKDSPKTIEDGQKELTQLCGYYWPKKPIQQDAEAEKERREYAKRYSPRLGASSGAQVASRQSLILRTRDMILPKVKYSARAGLYAE